MKALKLEHLTYCEAEEYSKSGAIVMLPISPLEAHGPHLPLGVDFFGARILAEMSAAMLLVKCIQMPKKGTIRVPNYNFQYMSLMIQS